MNDADDSDLAARARAGDRTAMEALWLRHRSWVASVVAVHRPAAADLEDLLQDVAERFVRRVPDLADPAAFGGWLRAIAVNVARSAGRRAHVRKGVVSGGDHIDAVTAPDDRAVRERLAATLAAVEGLDAAYREPLVLKCVHGLPQSSIAALLDVPVTTIETRLARARRMVREALAEPTPRRRPEPTDGRSVLRAPDWQSDRSRT